MRKHMHGFENHSKGQIIYSVKTLDWGQGVTYISSNFIINVHDKCLKRSKEEDITIVKKEIIEICGNSMLIGVLISELVYAFISALQLCSTVFGWKIHFCTMARIQIKKVLDYLAESPQNHSLSPVGPLCSTTSRRTLIYLILTLNHMYPDYDFSMVRAHHFSKECGLSSVKQKIENYLLEAEKVWVMDNGEDTPLLECVWKAIDEVIDLADCEMYSYMPEVEGDPFFERGMIQFFNFFFYNKKLKRILCFSCRCLSKLAIDDSSADEMISDEETIFLQGMDIE